MTIRPCLEIWQGGFSGIYLKGASGLFCQHRSRPPRDFARYFESVYYGMWNSFGQYTTLWLGHDQHLLKLCVGSSRAILSAILNNAAQTINGIQNLWIPKEVYICSQHFTCWLPGSFDVNNEGKTKRLSFCRIFICVFANENGCILSQMSLKLVPTSIDLDNGLVPNWRQAIIWTNDCLVCRRIYMRYSAAVN